MSVTSFIGKKMDSRRSKRRYVSKRRARFQNMGRLSFVRRSNSEAQETEQRADVEPALVTLPTPLAMFPAVLSVMRKA